MNKKYDVYAIGNALVDMEYEVQDDFFSRQKIDKGLMTLVDETRQNDLLNALGTAPLKQQCGGSAANTIIAVAQFGAKSFYSCKVAKDPIGNFYFQDLQDNGVDSNLQQQNRENGITGKCLVLITPDAERTMNTYLGITSTIGKSEVDASAIKGSKYMYMEGYLVASPSGREAAIFARKVAEAAGVKTALTFSDVNMVKFFREGMHEMIGGGVDLLFCNESEAMAWAETQDMDEVIESLKKIAKTFVVTRSEKGAVVFDGQKLISVESFPVRAIDTNGAGDMYAGAFLYGITQGHDYAQAGKLASLAASRVVSQFGPRLRLSDVLDIKKQVLQG
ncbi:MAG TPA: adenosine kinase [Bacteriovoracaceae bacterium]|nr:adenosine kinase [Bacteriovoracaceae bacterium]